MNISNYLFLSTHSHRILSYPLYIPRIEAVEKVLTEVVAGAGVVVLLEGSVQPGVDTNLNTNKLTLKKC